MEVKKTIQFKVGELNKGKEELLDKSLNTSILAVKDFIQLSIKNNTTSKNTLHHLGYKEIRNKYNLPACVIIQAKDKACEIVKSWKTNKRRLNKSISIPEPKALSIRYNNVVFDVIKTDNKMFNFWISFGIKKGKSGKHDCRIYIPLIVNSDYQKEYLTDLINQKYKKGSADLVKKGNDYYFNIVLKKEVEFNQKNNYQPVGVDVGINNLAVANINGKPLFFNGQRAIATKKHINKVKAIYQSRNNLKILTAIKGNEKNYFNHINHEISSKIVNKAKELKNPVIVMEDLTHIIESTKVKKKQRYIHQTWAFKKLQLMIQYKALWNSIPVVYIQPQYTSQVCPKCLSTNKRIKSNYKCLHCGYENNADLVGAINITKKFWEGISFPEKASINNAFGFSFSEPQAMNIGEAEKFTQEGGRFLSQTELVERNVNTL